MPSVPFTSPITTAAISAVPNPLTTNPGTKRATSSRHNALNTQCASIRPIEIRLYEPLHTITGAGKERVSSRVGGSRRADLLFILEAFSDGVSATTSRTKLKIFLLGRALIHVQRFIGPLHQFLGRFARHVVGPPGRKRQRNLLPF